MIAGLEDVSEGTIEIDGKVVNDLSPKERDIAMVFQDYALYPHMTVAENMSLSLKLKKVPADEISRRVKKVASMLDLEKQLSKRPKELSGGQRQRVALGRAIVRTPKVFMFDEPLSNLDPKLRAYMRVELKKLHRQLNTTMLYVTHDQVEAMTLGDRIIVINEGKIQQIGKPLDVYSKPQNRFVASFIGFPPMNFFACKIEKKNSDVYLYNKNIQLKWNQDNPIAKKLTSVFDGSPDVVLGVRAEDMNIKRIHKKTENGKGAIAKIQSEVRENNNNGSDSFKDQIVKDDSFYLGFKDNTFPAHIEVIELVSPEVYIHLTTLNEKFIVRADNSQADQVNVGDEVEIEFNEGMIHFFETVSGRIIQ
jgi:multiple sugar transport system ATP-binding protein